MWDPLEAASVWILRTRLNTSPIKLCTVIRSVKRSHVTNDYAVDLIARVYLALYLPALALALLGKSCL